MSLSEIRVNTTKTRTGVGTITYTETGPVITGIATADKFSGEFEGAATITSGNITATTGTFSGNVSIGGTLTYEDVTNIDSVGIITAREGIKIPDDKYIKIGGSDDLQIYHAAGAASHINNTGLLNIDGTTGVRLEYNNATRVDCTSSGVSLVGDVDVADKIIHTGDTNTMIRFPADDTFTVTTANVERFRIGSNGYIGVGDFSSKSRTDPLNVDSGIGTCNIGGNYIHLKRYSGGNTQYITAPQNNADLHISADNFLAFGVDHSSSMYSMGTEAIRITSAGLVGINSTSPSKQLEVQGTDVAFRLKSTVATGRIGMEFYDTAAQKGYFGYPSSGNDNMSIQQNEAADLYFYVNGGTRLNIKSTGQVRIDGPTAAAHGLRFTPNGWNGYDNRMGYCGSSGADFWWSSNWNPTDGARDHSGYATNFIRQNISSGYLSFGTGAVNASASERLHINKDGKIGVGLVPNAWQASTVSKVLQIGNSSVWDYNLQQFDLGQNFYYDGTNYKYIANGYATKLAQIKSDGSFIFYNAASGTGGNNLTWLQKIKVNNGYAGTVDVKGIPAHLRLYSQRDTSDWDSTDPIGKLDFYVGDDTTNNLPYNAGFIHCLNAVDNANEPSGELVLGTTTANLSGGAVERLRITGQGKVKFFQDPVVRASATGGGVDTYGGSGLGEGGYIHHYTARDGGHYRRVMDIASVGDASWGSQIRFVTHDDGGASTTSERARITHDGTWLHNSKHTTIPYQTRTKLIPYFWDRNTGATKFIFAFSVSVSTPKLWILTARQSYMAGTIKFGFSQRTNWPSSGVGRMHNSMWRISNYGDGGDNEYSQLRENENVYQNAAGTYKVTVGEKSVDYIYQNHGGSAHSEFGDNAGKAQDYYSRWMWHFNTCPQSPVMQYHTCVCEMDLIGGWNYDGTDDSATNFYAYVED